MATNPSSGKVVLANGTVATVKRVNENFENGNDQPFIGAVAGKAIRILALFVSQGTNTGQITLGNSVTTSTSILKSVNLDILSGFVLPFCEAGWGESISGEGVLISNGGADNMSILALYAEV